MTKYYEAGFHTGVIKFAQYLKEHSFLCDPGNWCSFQAIDADDLDDLVEEFLSNGEICEDKRKVNMNNKMERKLDESYNHIKSYLKNQKILKDMCQYCGDYGGEEHDYEECLDMPCFKCFLGYSYLEWETSFE